MHPLATRFHALFKGNDQSYGLYFLTGKEVPDERGKIKGTVRFVTNAAAGPIQFSDHLDGITGLGIVPLDSKGKTYFGAVDIDVYDGSIDIKALCSQIKSKGYPLVACRSKSGGIHLYMFSDEKGIPTPLFRKKLRLYVEGLGHKVKELFPAQDTLLLERGESAGSFLNLPYYRADRTDRYAWDDNGVPLPPEDFLDLAVSRSVSESALKTEKVKGVEFAGPFTDGPPCLNKMATEGQIGEGVRNIVFYNIAVFCRKAYEDRWEEKAHEFNEQVCRPPLTRDEAQRTINSVKSEKYFYTCAREPLVNNCSKSACLMCKHGIGGAGIGLPIPGTLTLQKSEPPLWFVDIEGAGRICLTTEQINSPRLFKLAVLSECRVVLPQLKQETWDKILAKCLEVMTVIEVPESAKPLGLFKSNLEEFMEDGTTGENLKDLLRGKPVLNETGAYFRSVDLRLFLNQKKSELSWPKVIAALKADGWSMVILPQGEAWHKEGYISRAKELEVPAIEGQGY